MKKYKFRLQTVLDIKEKVLEEKLLELSKIVKVFNDENQRLHEFESNKQKSLQELNDMYAKSDVLDISQVQAYKAYLGKVSFDIRKQEQVLEQISKIMQEKQLEANDALKEKKIFEKLKENETKAFYKEFIKKENAENDDIVSCRYGRR